MNFTAAEAAVRGSHYLNVVARLAPGVTLEQARRNEMAARAAIGATGTRLIRQMLVEATLLSVAGGLLGVALAPIGMRGLQTMVPNTVLAPQASALDPKLLGFAAQLAMLTGVLGSIIPAAPTARVSLNQTLQHGGRAGIDLGFRADHVLTVRTSLPMPKYSEFATRMAFYDRVVAGIRALPGVEGAAYISTLPFLSIGNTTSYRIEGLEVKETQDSMYRVGTSDYLRTIGAELVEGRLPDDRGLRDGHEARQLRTVRASAELLVPGEPGRAHDRRSAGDGPFGASGHQRDRPRAAEIGVRFALGASASARLIISRGLLLTGLGLTIGLGLAWAATRTMGALLYGIDAGDPATFSSVAGLLILVALVACSLSALRAARVDPVRVLRQKSSSPADYDAFRSDALTAAGASIITKRSADNRSSSPLSSTTRRSPTDSSLILPRTVTTVGEVLGHYRVLARLGGGNMGEVFRAEDLRLGRHVALKLLPADRGLATDAFERFEREARLASSLNHPHICTVHDFGEHDGRPYIVMELLDGVTLKHRLADGPVDQAAAVSLATQVAEALEAAHARGIIHRDIKPANIFVTRERQVKVLDFGLAKLVDSDASTLTTQAGDAGNDMPSAGTALGTVAYMSPEQARSEPLDARTDLFSFGCVLYEMTTGRRAFDGETPAVVFHALLGQEPPPPSRLNPAVGPQVERVIARALEKDRTRRYASAAEILGDLRRAGQAAVRTPRRMPMLVAPMLLACVAIVVAMVALKRGPAVAALAERDVVMIADLANHTGDAVFDQTLKQALAIHLQQTPFLNILSEQRIDRTLRQMQRGIDERVVGATAREVCQRTNAKALIEGSIATLGGSYVVGLEAVDCTDGEVLAREQERADGQAAVLDALSAASARLRQQLGESLPSIERFNTPIEEATTTSLEALRAYSLGLVARRTTGDAAAVPFFAQSVSVDPQFALAHARLSASYANLSEIGLARASSTRAFELRDRVSEYERLYIESRHHAVVTGDTDAELEALRLIIETYPRDFASRNNLCVRLNTLGRLHDAATVCAAARDLAPEEGLPLLNLAVSQYFTGDYAGARRTTDEALAKADTPAARAFSLGLAFLEGDPARIVREQQAYEAAHGRFGAVRLRARYELSRGRIRAAHELVQQAVASGRSSTDVRADSLLEIALAAAAFDDVKTGIRIAEEVLRTSTEPSITIAAGSVLARSGLLARADRIISDGAGRLNVDTLTRGVTLAIAQAHLFSRRGQVQAALDALRIGHDLEPRYPELIHTRGIVALDAGRLDEAAAEFRRLLSKESPRAVVGALLQPQPRRIGLGYHDANALAHVGLARADARRGRRAAAIESYRAFLAAFPNADTDLPLLTAARRELATLERSGS